MTTSLLEIHPISSKLIKQHHPWITLDRYSARFPVAQIFLSVKDQSNQFLAVCLHDPKHAQIKARVWSTQKNWQESSFPFELRDRLKAAKEKRKDLPSLRVRENFFVVFGEADLLPGLFILKLGSEWIVQIYALVWEDLRDLLTKTLFNTFPEITLEHLWWQVRAPNEKGQQPPVNLFDENKKMIFPVSEYGVNYHVHLGESYDYGLYPDMAALRFKLAQLVASKKSLLNLFCYTGAFSLWALKLGVKDVCSVDLSNKYLNWLEDNLKLNPQLLGHSKIESSASQALLELKKKQKKFDFIICDPPSASTDGKKKISAFDSYETLIPQMLDVLSPSGDLLLFLNTHTVSKQKFFNHIQQILEKKGVSNFVPSFYSLGDDCPTFKGFPEGDYLKGVLISKIKTKSLK